MKTIVVSGATSGIGLSIVKELVANKELVIALGRTKETCEVASYLVDPENKLTNLHYLPADLGSLEEIKKVSKKIKEITKDKGIDVLINNAGIVPKWRLTSKEGYEMQFAVNHLAPFYLTQLLLDDLRKVNGTVITSTSRSHRGARLNFKNLMLENNYHMLRAYKRSKLCNILFTYELNKRYTDIKAYAMDPGLVNTNIGAKRSSGFISWFWKTRAKHGKSPDFIANYYLDLIYDFSNDTLPYLYKYGKQIKPSRYSRNEDIQKRLWEESLKLIGVDHYG